MQIYHFFKEEMLCGRVPANAKLPSIRQLAQHLGVSRNPVETAYAQLVAEGYVINRAKSGYFAAALEQLASAHSKQPATRIVDGETEEHTALLSRAAKDIPGGDNIAFEYDQTDTERFPLAVWRRMTLRVLEPTARNLLDYGERKGERRLREQITSYLRQNRGVVCDPEQVIITAGTQQAAILLSALLKDEHRLLAVEAAMHPGLYRLFQHQRLNPIAIPLEADGISVETITANRSIRTVYVTPSHQFPYGIILPAAKRLQLLQWADASDSIIIEDDYDSDFLYEGRPVPALQGLDQTGRVVYMGTFSKALAPAIRLSFIILPPSLLQKYDREFTFYDQTASRLTQKAMELFMEEGHFARHVRRMRKVYRTKRETLLEAVDNYLGGRATISGAASGLHVILETDSVLPSSILVTRAGEQGVRLRPISDYHIDGEASPGFPADPRARFVLGFGGLSEHNIVEGIRRIAQACVP
ncbi:PLP-dependent aminotransferase family protein [Paenibacillus sp. sptzw28]|uniref:MocR-like pyridoxine biosynthesis transcription factor PdxR n=1 Tax=Paenibacillus sp. sptzw28 TaxID=715179 RepID=UPI001C6E3A6B|nr:PLP-dependent aminotransferase family protein [Paenibacillus sp. sptzw28]QYR21988.1 PLP-dependent aminotransferase family protein [Paenibacillus sp. sptzw28]